MEPRMSGVIPSLWSPAVCAWIMCAFHYPLRCAPRDSLSLRMRWFTPGGASQLPLTHPLCFSFSCRLMTRRHFFILVDINLQNFAQIVQAKGQRCPSAELEHVNKLLEKLKTSFLATDFIYSFILLWLYYLNLSPCPDTLWLISLFISHASLKLQWPLNWPFATFYI